MRDTNGKSKSTRISGTTKKSSANYTPEQRERMQQGLRILARMIARAHLRREAPTAGSAAYEPPSYD